jgi:hypothetical protein
MVPLLVVTRAYASLSLSPEVAGERIDKHETKMSSLCQADIHSSLAVVRLVYPRDGYTINTDGLRKQKSQTSHNKQLDDSARSAHLYSSIRPSRGIHGSP